MKGCYLRRIPWSQAPQCQTPRPPPQPPSAVRTYLGESERRAGGALCTGDKAQEACLAGLASALTAQEGTPLSEGPASPPDPTQPRRTARIYPNTSHSLTAQAHIFFPSSGSTCSARRTSWFRYAQLIRGSRTTSSRGSVLVRGVGPKEHLHALDGLVRRRHWIITNK